MAWWEFLFSCLGDDDAKLSYLVVTVIALVSASLSLVGTSFVITHFMWRGKASQFSSFLVFFLSLSDFGASVTIIITNITLISIWDYNDPSYALPDWACYILRGIYNFFEIASLCWTTCIALALFLAIVMESPVFLPRAIRKNYQKSEALKLKQRRRGTKPSRIIRDTLFGYDRILLYVFNAASWLFSLALLLTMIFGRMYEPSRVGWCTATKPVGDLILWTLPICIFFGLNFILYTWINLSLYIKKRKQPDIVFRRLSSVVRKRVSLYVLVYLICWVPDVIIHLLPYITPCDSFLLYGLTSLVTPLQGFLNCIVYALTNSEIHSRLPKTRLAIVFVLSPLLVIPSLLYLLFIRWGWRLAEFAYGQMVSEPPEDDGKSAHVSETASCVVEFNFGDSSGGLSDSSKGHSIQEVVEERFSSSVERNNNNEDGFDFGHNPINELLFGASPKISYIETEM